MKIISLHLGDLKYIFEQPYSAVAPARFSWPLPSSNIHVSLLVRDNGVRGNSADVAVDTPKVLTPETSLCRLTQTLLLKQKLAFFSFLSFFC